MKLYLKNFNFFGISYPDERVLVLFRLRFSRKNTILYRLKLGKNVSTIPSIGFSVETITFNKINLIAYDINGRNLYRHHLLETQGIIFMIDSNDRKQIYEAQKNVQNFNRK